jgi:hypothetical protein
VIALFAVDSSGVVEMPSFRVLSSSQPGFTVAVAATLPRLRYRPARICGRAVRMWVQQTFEFGR